MNELCRHVNTTLSLYVSYPTKTTQRPINSHATRTGPRYSSCQYRVL